MGIPHPSRPSSLSPTFPRYVIPSPPGREAPSPDGGEPTAVEPSTAGSATMRVSAVRKKVLPEGVEVTGLGITPSNRTAAFGEVGCDLRQDKKLAENTTSSVLIAH